MTLDNFQLPVILMTELYKDSLVALDSNQLKPDSLKETPFVSLGNNQKKVLLLVKDDQAVYLPDHDLNFLLGVLTACKLTMADVALLNLHQNPDAGYQSLMKAFKPGIVICFGIELHELAFPLEFPHYQLQAYNKQTYLAAPSLKVLAVNVEEKKRLWTCLKKLFSI